MDLQETVYAEVFAAVYLALDDVGSKLSYIAQDVKGNRTEPLNGYRRGRACSSVRSVSDLFFRMLLDLQHADGMEWAKDSLERIHAARDAENAGEGESA